MSGFKLKSTAIFPSRVTGGLALDVDKANGNYTIAIDYTNLAVVDPYTPVATDYVLVWDSSINNYFLAPATSLKISAFPPAFVAQGTYTLIGQTANLIYVPGGTSAGSWIYPYLMC
jgi:hypothetical protein